MKEFILRCLDGENTILQDQSCLHDIDVNTRKVKWCLAGPEHGINPFGKLIKQPQKQNINKKTGKIFIQQHKKYHHGFFMNLTCSENFYNNNKSELDKYILTEEAQKDLNINLELVPTWL